MSIQIFFDPFYSFLQLSLKEKKRNAPRNENLLEQVTQSFRWNSHATIHPSPFQIVWSLDEEVLRVGMFIEERHFNAKCCRVRDNLMSLNVAIQQMSERIRTIANTSSRIQPGRRYEDDDLYLSITYYWGRAIEDSLTDFEPLRAGTLLRSAGKFDFKAAAHLTNAADIISNNSEYVEKTLTICIEKHSPLIIWENPPDIVYGTPIDVNRHLNAICLPLNPVHASPSADTFEPIVIEGTWNYDPSEGALLPAGQHTLTVSFHPHDKETYVTTVEKSVQIRVLKRSPRIEWNFPGTLIYGQKLSYTNWNAICLDPIDGVFSYFPAEGSTLHPAGMTHEVRAEFNPIDNSNYSTVSITRHIFVERCEVMINWESPQSMEYGTKLSFEHLNAKCNMNIGGFFEYDPPSGTILPVGTENKITVVFQPCDTENFSPSSKTVTVVVYKKTPSIKWMQPAPITYGTELSGEQLNAECMDKVEGSFMYSTSIGTVLSAGSHRINVKFIPDDEWNYSTAEMAIFQVVMRKFPTLTWPSPSSIEYGTELGDLQLCAICNEGIDGYFEYEPNFGTILPAKDSHALSVKFTPSDIMNYCPVSSETIITVRKKQLTLSWKDPESIFFGTELSDIQLNAICTSDIDGDYEFKPGYGTVLEGGVHTLSVTFTPLDSANFSIVEQVVTIHVHPAPVTLIAEESAALPFGTSLEDFHLRITCLEEIDGNFEYLPPLGTTFQNAGPQQVLVTFQPHNQRNFAATSATMILVVHKKIPELQWPQPVAIVYSCELSKRELNASCCDEIAGEFVYDPPFGTVLDAGLRQELRVTFIPDDGINFATVSHSVHVDVLPFMPTIDWDSPTSIVYGTKLSREQLNAICVEGIEGIFIYDPPEGTQLTARESWTLSCTFFPNNENNYSRANRSVFITVHKLMPTLHWQNPENIIYGTPLSSLHLNAKCLEEVPGSFHYYPSVGTILEANESYSLRVEFVPHDDINFFMTTFSVPMTVLKMQPILLWDEPDSIPYSTALSALQLNAVCTNDVIGEFVYSPGIGTVLPIGEHTLNVTFHAIDGKNFSSAEASVIVKIVEAIRPNIFWHPPSPIVFGTPLSDEQLCAICTDDVEGDFEYNPPTGVILPAGIGRKLTVVFKPKDSIAYTVVKLTVLINVEKLPTSISWQAPASIKLGTALSEEQLNAVCNEATPGLFEYHPPLGTVLPAGIDQILQTKFIPDDSNFSESSSCVKISVIEPRQVLIRWTKPANITYGTLLTDEQLNAQIDETIEGEITYSPSFGELLQVGDHLLTATFSPIDLIHYEPSSLKLNITVIPFTPNIEWHPPSFLMAGTHLTDKLLNATCVDLIEGTFEYFPPVGTILEGGREYCLSFDFHPYDNRNYSAVRGSEMVLVEAPLQPTIIWREPTNIPYNTLLSSTQLCANILENIDGDFSYEPTFGTKLPAGIHELQAKFYPHDRYCYSTVSKSVEICVEATKPTILWNEPSPLAFGTPLSKDQLNAICVEDIEGSFVYSHPEGAILEGDMNHHIVVHFYPLDSDNYFTVRKSVILTVIKQQEVPLTWNKPSAIKYGTPLSDLQLNAYSGANVSGLFDYRPCHGTILDAGDQELTVIFTPNDQLRFKVTRLFTSIHVEKYVPKIHWATPAKIFYGTELSDDQLNAVCEEGIPSTIVYSPPSGTLLSLGSEHILSVTFSPFDRNYSTVTASVIISVIQRTDIIIIWNNPSAITCGTPLSEVQLNATTNQDLEGYYLYDPPIGTILPAGTNQKLSVAFTAKENKYLQLDAVVFIDVLKIPTSIFWEIPAVIRAGIELSSSVLNAICNEGIDGIIEYYPPVGTVLPAGDHILAATFTPSNEAQYASSKSFVQLKVVEPVFVHILWSPPAKIIFGTELSKIQLNASCQELDDNKIDGIFVYNFPIGSVLSAGDHELSVVFQPSDQTYFKDTVASVILTVEKRPTSLSWSHTAEIRAGTPLSDAHLNAICNEEIDGRFEYYPSYGTVLPEGDHEVRVTFVPYSDSFSTATISINLTVVQPREAKITWPIPEDIIYGTELSEIQLNAKLEESATGKLQYNYPIGTTLAVGDNYELVVDFISDDPIHFLDSSKSVYLNVRRRAANFFWEVSIAQMTIIYGTALPEEYFCAQCEEYDDIEGTISYSHEPGDVLECGKHILIATFTPADLTCFSKVEAMIEVSVLPKACKIEWTEYLMDSIYGHLLQSDELNAKQTDEFVVEGEFIYLPKAGTLLDAGDHIISCQFFPTDKTHYIPSNVVYANKTILKYPTRIGWHEPNPITFGTELSELQLSAHLVDPAHLDGYFQYDPVADTLLPSGVHKLSATFFPSSTNFATAEAAVKLTVNKVSLSLRWDNPAKVIAAPSLRLTSEQLNASVTVDDPLIGFSVGTVRGEFEYSPAAGHLIDLREESLSLFVKFVPFDSQNFSICEKRILLMIEKPPLRLTSSSQTIFYGEVVTESLLLFYSNEYSLPDDGRMDYGDLLGTKLHVGDHELTVHYHSSELSLLHSSCQLVFPILVRPSMTEIQWEDPHDIEYGLPLSELQLNAKCDYEGTISYSHDFGTILDVGEYELTATFTPNDLELFVGSSATVTLRVLRPQLIIRWSLDNLKAGNLAFEKIFTASCWDSRGYAVDGSFSYSVDANFEVVPGLHEFTAIFQPEDDRNYSPTSQIISIEVDKITPRLVWSQPQDIPFLAHLSEKQLNAVCVDSNGHEMGTLTYLPELGTCMDQIGEVQLRVFFEPHDPSIFKSASLTVSLNVLRGIPTLTWQSPRIVAGDIVSEDLFDPIFTYPSLSESKFQSEPRRLSGDVRYLLDSEVGGDGVLRARTLPQPAQTGRLSLLVCFQPHDSEHFQSCEVRVEVEVCQNFHSRSFNCIHCRNWKVEICKTQLRWAQPIDLIYGSALTDEQLNARCVDENVSGNYFYSPAAGSVLPAGQHDLSVLFQPEDTRNYLPCSRRVTLTVQPAEPVIRWRSDMSVLPYGTEINPSVLEPFWEPSTAGNFEYAKDIDFNGLTAVCGMSEVRATFHPTDSSNYLAVTCEGLLRVVPLEPAIHCSHSPPQFEAEYQSTDLSLQGLTDALALSVLPANSGGFCCENCANTADSDSMLAALEVGEHAICVRFDPMEMDKYASTKISVRVIVLKKKCSISWLPQEIHLSFGTPLDERNYLCAVAVEERSGRPVEGFYSYDPPSGTLLLADEQPQSIQVLHYNALIDEDDD